MADGKKTLVISADVRNNFDVARMGYIARTRKMIGNEEFLAVLVKSFENKQ